MPAGRSPAWSRSLPPGVAGVVAATVAAVTRAVRACDGRRLRGPATAAPLLQTWPGYTHPNKCPVCRVLRAGNPPARALAEDSLGKQPFVMFLGLKNEISYIKNTLVGAVTCIEKFHPKSYTII